MNEADSELQDEFLTFPVSSVEAVGEMAGMLDGISRMERGDGYIFMSRRYFMMRRFFKLWNISDYAAGAGKIGLIRQPESKKTGFSLDRSCADDILAHGARSGRRIRNWNWVRGLLGSCGALYTPRTGYHLVFRPPEETGAAERLQSIIRSARFPFGARKKNGCCEVMLRDQQTIVTLLSRLGFVRCVLALEDKAVMRSVKCRVNQLVNCDSANINKSLEAARSQMALIHELENAGLVDDLPDPLKELVFARKANPSISLKELGQNLTRPISKSTVEYRWRRLENMIHIIVEGDGTNVLGKGRRQHV